MQIDATDLRMQLHKDDHLTLTNACGARLTTVSGTAWITVDQDADDVMMLPGESFVVPSNRSVFVGSVRGPVTLDLQGTARVAADAATQVGGLMRKIKALVGLERRRVQASGQANC